MKVITIANQKGGIGKTTTATTIANILKQRGYEVLLIDTDYQCNSTDTYNAQSDGVSTIYDVLLEEEDKRITLDEAVQETESGKIVASDKLLLRADTVLQADPLNGPYRLQEALRNSKGYDYVIIDTNPMVNQLLLNCLVASDEVVVPVTTDRYGLTALFQLYNTICDVKKRPNPNLKIAGLLVVKYNSRTTLGKEVGASLEEIAEKMGTKMFDTKIRQSVKIQEAQALKKPLAQYAPTSTVAMDYNDFVDELLREV